MSGARFWTAGLLGAVMVGASIALVAWLAHSLGLTGSCSSTGYSEGRPVPICSSGEVLRGLAIFPSVLLGLAGLVVAGRRAPRHRRTGSFGIAAWSVGYLVVGAGLISSAWDPASAATGLDRYGWAIPGFVFIPLGIGGVVFGLGRRRKARTARALLSHGTKAPAEILALRDTGVTINHNPRVHLELEVRPPNAAPFRAEKTVTVSRLTLPRVGDQVTVWFDPADPRTFALGLPERPTPAPAPVAAPEPASDPTTHLERLGRLHADGVLTDAEFAAAKARLLAPTQA